MERAALLTTTDVNVIRRYVHTKYAPLPGRRKAEIVAEAVRSALERRLPDLPEKVKARMTSELIRRCLVNERREVSAEDVLEVCEAEPWAEEIDPEPLARWIEEKTSGRWTRQQIESRLHRGWRSEAILAGAAGHRDAASVLPLPIPFAPPSFDPGVLDPASGAKPDYADGVEILAPGQAPGVFIDADAISSNRPLGGWRRHAAWLALVLALGAGAAIGLTTGERSPGAELGSDSAVHESLPGEGQKPGKGMPQELRYADFDAAAVKAYLRSRDSLLADEPYFGAIVASARKYDVNPLLLFAITGQEQGFVPRSGKYAKQIANNPFNVFHSWQEYNTDIADSSAIAAKLIAKLGASRPAGEEPFGWLNRIYAEDPAWADGVRQLFEKLVSLSEPSRR